MKVSTKGRYALRVMIDLAKRDSDENVSLKEISLNQGISVKYLEQIVASLSKMGLLKSVRGSQGGYRLARPAQEYTIGEILRVTEGSLAPIACLENSPNQCDRYDECSTIEFWEGLFDVITKYIDGVTLEDLVHNEINKAGNDFII